MTTGFNNTPPDSERRNYTSWGRTRQPKNLAGGVHGSEITPVLNGDPTALAADEQPKAGYATESQRYLQMYFHESADVEKTVTVYGYVYAFKKWFILQDNAGANVVWAVKNSTETKNGANAIDISGIDRLYFSTDEAFVANDEFYAAVNTISVK
tara:strand:+ start:1049 stop:1510 length:462 start_codon:yes stop_codon:yes gene_type:complete